MKKGFFFILIFCSFALASLAQSVLLQDTYNGGVTCGGYDPGWNSNAIGTIQAHIAPGSTIRKALLFIGIYGNPKSKTIYINGNPIPLSTDLIVGQSFSFSGATFTLNLKTGIKDITNIISDTTSIIKITPPVSQPIVDSGRFVEYYIFIEYNNPMLSRINNVIVLNHLNAQYIMNYPIHNINNINNSFDVGLAIHSSEICSTVVDGEFVFVNADSIGLIGGTDINSISPCDGVDGSYYYESHTLYGLSDDTPDSLVSGTDGLANIKSYISSPDSLDVKFKYKGSAYGVGAKSNAIWNLFLTYTTPCDTFSTSVSADTAICLGDSVPLHATGGIKYQWQPSYGLSCDTCANPIASPDSSVTYTVRIYDNDSCSKVLPVRVLVHKIKFNYYIDSATCGDSNGAVFITTPNIAQYTLDSQSNATGIFTHLSGGSYNVLLTDSFGCQWQDTVHIGFSNNAYAAFLLTPFIGQAPLAVHTTNLSNHTNVYLWIVNGDTLHGNTITYTFDSAGNYTVTLIACHNSYPCCDTVSKSITVLPNTETVVTIPNVFTPNGDGINDNFIVKIKNVKSGSMQIYNRWGTAIVGTLTQNADENGNLTLKWNGKTAKYKACSAGTYYYVVTYTTPEGKTKTVKGYVTLLR